MAIQARLRTRIEVVTPPATRSDSPKKNVPPTLAGPPIGVHASVAGGLEKAFENAALAGCDVVQIFVKNQRQWRAKPLTDDQIRAFRDARAKSRATIPVHLNSSPDPADDASIIPVTAHASYLLNLCAPNESIRKMSIDAMVDELTRCEALDIPGLVFHPGAHCRTEPRSRARSGMPPPLLRGDKGGLRGVGDRPPPAPSLARGGAAPARRLPISDAELCGITCIAQSIDEVLYRCAGFKTKLLLEFTAGQGSAIGWHFEQLAEIMNRVRHPGRVGVCLDTCHLFAAGYDFRKPDGYAAMIDQLDATVGIANVKCIHCNDSKRELGSRVDRHAHTGQGQIGKSGFANFLNDPRFRTVPFILETPKGKDEKGRDWDVLNMKALRRLVRKRMVEVDSG